jgi:hypothetical protein
MLLGGTAAAVLGVTVERSPGLASTGLEFDVFGFTVTSAVVLGVGFLIMVIGLTLILAARRAA